MRVRLLKSKTTPHAKYAIGTVINLSKGVADRMIKGGEAERYKGEYPPRKKMRTQFFKPK